MSVEPTTSDSSSSNISSNDGKQQEPFRNHRFLRPWIQFLGFLEKKTEDGFASVGGAVGARPFLTLLGVLLMTGLCIFFLTFTTVEDEGSRLWIPQDSYPALNRDYIEQKSGFGKPSRLNQFILYSSTQNMLTINSVRETFRAHDRIQRVEYKSGNQVYTADDLCDRRKDNNECKAKGILLFWNMNSTLFEEQITTEADLLAAVSAPNYPNGDIVSRNGILADYVEDAVSGDLVSAKGVLMSYLMEDDSNDNAFEWEAKVVDVLKSYKKTVSGYKFVFMLHRSVDDELGRSVGGDIMLMVITYTIMITFVCLALGHFDPVRFRGSTAMGGVLLIILATLSAYGISALTGAKFTSLAQILPFLILGVGVDDMFILVASFDRTSPSDDVRTRCSEGLRDAGVTITLTSLTNAVAFLLGSTTSIPAVSYFCIYASITILVNFLYMVFGFTAILALEAKRRNAHRVDCFCCFRSSSAPVAEDFEVNKDGQAEHLTFTQKLFRDRISPFLMKPMVKALVIFAFLALTASSVYGVMNVTQGFELQDVTPDDSYARDFLDMRDQEFRDVTYDLDLYIKDVDYHSSATTEQLDEYVETITDSKWSLLPLESWMVDFKTYIGATAPYSGQLDANGNLNDKAVFYDALNNFLAQPEYIRHSVNINFFAEPGADNITTIRSSRLVTDMQSVRDVPDRKAITEDLRVRDQGADVNKGGLVAFAFNYYFIFWESFHIIVDELINNLVLSLVAVAAVCLFLLIHPLAVIILAAVVALIDLHLLASVYYWGMHINSISVINLVMAVGLVVDYSAHLMHSFLTAQGTREERVTKAMTKMGSSISLGGFTTFIGIAPLGLASSEIFRTFFRMFLGIIGYGLLHGLILLPVLLSIFGPQVEKRNDESVSQSKRSIELGKVSHAEV